MKIKRMYGVILPHFGEHATPQKMIAAARQIEAYGFDSIWVRDHLTYHPHPYESTDKTFYDTFVTLTALATSTERIVLGTAALIPQRHPLLVAQQLANLTHFLGPNRLIVGFGIGGMGFELNNVGLGGLKLPDVHREQVEIMRRIWTGETVNFDGAFYHFENADVYPTPQGEIPIWYCGGSAAAVRRAVEYCQGWLTGHSPFRTLEKRLRRLRRLSEEAGREPPIAGSIPFTSPGRTREEGLSKLNVAALLESANHHGGMEKPESGRFETADDLAGGLLVGPPSDIVETIRQQQALGQDLTVFDLRYRFADFPDCLAIIGEEVLPELRRGDA
jgi:alkanesulfonate monooxygenase SsuD/methylene tetrahydromethanopterin reductase-like flavin-dependent oxidoreductase (luciferase family)